MVSENKKRLMITITEEQLKKLEEVCKETGLSKSSVIAFALSEWLAERTK